MQLKISTKIRIVAIAGAILLSAAAQAQQRGSLLASRPTTYDVKRESIVQGTVLNYMEDSPLPPMGAHVTLQTASGIMDVHLGPASYLRTNHFFIATGDSVRFIGVSAEANDGHVFLARLAQKGDQSIVVRSPRGLLRASARVLPQNERPPTTLPGSPR